MMLARSPDVSVCSTCDGDQHADPAVTQSATIGLDVVTAMGSTRQRLVQQQENFGSVKSAG